jgi:hypothetical protein
LKILKLIGGAFLIYVLVVVASAVNKNQTHTSSPQTEDAPTPQALRDLQIVSFSNGWNDEYKMLARWRVKVHNNSKVRSYKDIHFKTRYYGASGTEIDQSWLGHTEYVVIRPGQTIKIQFTEFAHSQTTSGFIVIDQAVPG